ncbi:glycoside hydrolase family 79 [Pyrrhoderma noxium]|uniref:Glycoside hydrolase family 79 n=1 Tax=Pyrrhoderma noxium TaxID=2282107 RepID=A0A286U4X2_9AGAM|nr:glycoside hydrolase family 79 [Pyrrhoderma noxium]
MDSCESPKNSHGHLIKDDHSLNLIPDGHLLGKQLSSLPYELLSEIFLWCCPNIFYRTFCHPHSALTLSHVCRKWRSVVLGTPQLWTYTNLQAKRLDIESTTNLVLLWAEHAGACPLVIDLDLSEYAQYKTPDNVLPAILELTELAEEAKSSLQTSSISTSRLSVSIEPSTDVKFPYVSEKFYWMNSDSTSVGNERINGYIHLRISMQPCIIFGMEGHSDFGPYLVHLDLKDTDEEIIISLSETHGIIRTYPNLEYLSIRIGSMEDEIPTRDTVTLSNLKTLCLEWEKEVDPGVILESIRAPLLETLELDGTVPDNWHYLFSFLQHNSGLLRKLDLYKADCSSVDLLSCLSLCPSLDRLWVEDSAISEEIVREFTEFKESRESAIQVLKNLRTLGIVRTNIFDAPRIFRELIKGGYIWELTKLDGIFISECEIYDEDNGNNKTEPWPNHLLRKRFLEGVYSDLH